MRRAPTDFVELPSQLFEHWLLRPEVLRCFARHFETGAPVPDALLDKVLASATFNQGFATVEYRASALFDLDLRRIAVEGAVDAPVAEGATLAQFFLMRNNQYNNAPSRECAPRFWIPNSDLPDRG